MFEYLYYWFACHYYKRLYKVDHPFHFLAAVAVSAIQILPELFGIVSTVWFCGGKRLTYLYGENVITPMIEEGMNPGLMIYQPFK